MGAEFEKDILNEIKSLGDAIDRTGEHIKNLVSHLVVANKTFKSAVGVAEELMVKDRKFELVDFTIGQTLAINDAAKEAGQGIPFLHQDQINFLYNAMRHQALIDEG